MTAEPDKALDPTYRRAGRRPPSTPRRIGVTSPTSTVKQRVGLTDIEVDYSRPGMKGREIFGGLIPYDQVWRTGA